MNNIKLILAIVIIAILSISFNEAIASGGMQAFNYLTGGTLTNNKFCTYNSSTNLINCNSEGGEWSMTYPGAGIPISTGEAWGASLTDNSSNWNTAYGWGNHASANYLTISAFVSTTTHPYFASSTHSHQFVSLVNKPTTLSGYGITDALTSASYYATTSVPNNIATTTSKNGFDISDGCYAIDGTCIGGSSGGSGTVNSGLAGHLAYYPSDGTEVDDSIYLQIDDTHILASDPSAVSFTEDLADGEGTDGIGYNLLSVGMESASSSIDGAGFKMYGGDLSESNDNQTRSMSGGGFYMVGGNLSMDSDVDFSTIVAASSGGFTMGAGTLIAYEQELTGAGIAINGNGWSIENNGDSYIRGGDIYLSTGQATSSARYGKILLDTGYTETSIAELDTLLLTEQRKFQFPDLTGTFAVIDANGLITLTNASSSVLSVSGTSYLNTIATGIWNGTAIGVGYGGTGITGTPSYGQILVGNGTNYTLTATSALGIIQPDYPSFSYATSTAWVGTSTRAIGPAYNAETWVGAKCFTNTGTVNVVIGDGTNKTTAFVASTTVGSITFSANNTFTAGEPRYIDVGSPASTPTAVSCTFYKTY